MKSRLKSLLLFILLMTFASSAYAFDEWNSILPLRGKWKFSIGDNPLWASPEFNDADWEEIRVPSSWENEGFHGYNGYAWYRVKFDFHEPGSDRLFYISLGYIDDVDQVFLNGKLIGSTGSFPPKYETAYSALRRYPIPKNQMNLNGTNVLAVRVYDAQLEGGILSGDIGIYVKQYDMKLSLNLEGEWEIRLGDDEHQKFSDSETEDRSFEKSLGKMSTKVQSTPETKETWEKINVPGFWESQGIGDYDGFAWYKKSFNLPRNVSTRKMVLVLGKIDDIDEAYVNGQLVGSTGEIYDDPFFISHSNNEYQEFRGYYIPDNLLKPGQVNTVEVRVYDGFKDGGIYEGPVGLVTQDEYRKYWRDRKKQNFWEKLFGNEK